MDGLIVLILIAIFIFFIFLFFAEKSIDNETSTFKKTSGNYNPTKVSYDELLKDEKWKEKRLKILERDEYKCQWCGRKYNLHVHHKYYLKYPNNELILPWKYKDEALMTLCYKCHKKYHEKYKVRTLYTKF